MARRSVSPAPPEGVPQGAQDRSPLDLLPAPVRRLGGIALLTLTLWLASILALVS
jgi:hypothetical protein